MAVTSSGPEASTFAGDEECRNRLFIEIYDHVQALVRCFKVYNDSLYEVIYLYSSSLLISIPFGL